MRLSPANSFNDIVEHETEAVYAAVVAGFAPLGLSYLHVVEGPVAVTEQIRSAFPGTLIVNAAFSLPTTRVQRLRLDAPLNPADESSFYGGTDAGYIDYPALETSRREVRDAG